jgi:hypothetical protein
MTDLPKDIFVVYGERFIEVAGSEAVVTETFISKAFTDLNTAEVYADQMADETTSYSITMIELDTTDYVDPSVGANP